MKRKKIFTGTARFSLITLPVFIFFITMLSSCGEPSSDFMRLPVGLEDKRDWEIGFNKLSRKFKMKDVEVVKYITVERFIETLKRSPSTKKAPFLSLLLAS